MILGIFVLTGITGCKKDWLKPEPLSFFSPSNAYIDAAGMRAALVACARNARIEYYGDNPPIPAYWGGFVLRPDWFDFWQGRPSRLHDRFAYARAGDSWKIDRLSP